MAKYKISNKGNLITITRKQFGAIPVNGGELQFFNDNFLPGFFRPKLENPKKMTYTAPKGIPLSKYIEQQLDVQMFYSVIAQIVEITKKVSHYNLFIGNLVLNENLVYVKEPSGELFFLYEPLNNRGVSTNVFGFIYDVVKKMRTQNFFVKGECELLANFLMAPENNRIEILEGYIKQRYPQIYQQIGTADMEKSGFISSNRLSYQEHYAAGFAGESETTLLDNFAEDAETTLLAEEEDEETTLLAPQLSAVITRSSTGEEWEINKNEFTIGKKEGNDLAIKDNKAISRFHAVIIRREDEFYIKDNDSTNHSYINGELLESNEENRLSDGDIVKLADEEFSFKEIRS